MNKLRILVSVATVAVLATMILRTDMAALGTALSSVSFPAIVACLALVQAQIVLSAVRWRFTAGRLGQTIPIGTAIREYYVATLLNQLLPGGMGGDAIRAFRMRDEGAGGWKLPAKAVIFERLSGQVAFFLLAMTGLCLWPFVTDGSPLHNAILYLAIGVGSVAILVLLLIWGRRTAGREDGIRTAILEVFIRRKAWLFHIATSPGIVLSYVAVFFIAAQATGSELPWVAGLTIIPFCLVAMLIPTGFGGWGTREAAAMALWPMLGGRAVDGLAASVTYGWLSLAGAAPGLIFLAATAFAKRPSHA